MCGLMTIQTRVKNGKDFEEKVCRENNYYLDQRSPIINWAKGMRTIPTRIVALDFNAQKFLGPITLSDIDKIEKRDAINENGFGIEIKKYHYINFERGIMVSEFLKISTQRVLKSYRKLTGLSDHDIRIKYNNFINDMYFLMTSGEKGTRIIDRLKNSNIGIQCKDGFIPKDRLKYFWLLNTRAWRGFHRLSVYCRLI